MNTIVKIASLSKTEIDQTIKSYHSFRTCNNIKCINVFGKAKKVATKYKKNLCVTSIHTKSYKIEFKHSR